MAYRNPIIYERLDTLVRSNGMVMLDIAKKLSISSGNISDWKAGRAVPSIDKLIRIADYFQVSIDYLVGREQYSTTQDGSADIIELCNIYKDLDREGKVSVVSQAYQQRRRILDGNEKEAERGTT